MKVALKQAIVHSHLGTDHCFRKLFCIFVFNLRRPEFAYRYEYVDKHALMEGYLRTGSGSFPNIDWSIEPFDVTCIFDCHTSI